MEKIIGRVVATEKQPTTIDEFYFWTKKDRILSPFDVVKVEHIDHSISFGIIEEISHITDSASYLSNFISNDFGNVETEPNMHRIGMNFVKAKILSNTKNIYTPALDGKKVMLVNESEALEALGLKNIKNPLTCGYMEMYKENKIKIPVQFNSQFLLGPEGAHLNISGISGLAAKTSYTMFLMKAIQENYLQNKDQDNSVAFVMFNVKGRDLLAIDEPDDSISENDKSIYTDTLGLSDEPFKNVSYYYPFSDQSNSKTHSVAKDQDVEAQIDLNKGFKYKYIYEDDKDNIDLLLANIDDSTGTMDAIINFIVTGQGGFNEISNWDDFIAKVGEYTKSGRQGNDKEITVASWRKFKRVISSAIRNNDIFSNRVVPTKNEVRLKESITNIKKNAVYVIDIAKLDQDTQAFVFGDVIKAIYDLKLGQENRDEADIPKKIVIFIDELNKYASKDVPKNSPILRQVIDISERGRSLGIILFSVEQFKSAIHDRVKGNCATHAYGRTNAIEVSKSDYRYIPKVYRNMLTRLNQGEYIIEHPIFRSLLNIKFPKPLYKQFKNG